MSEVFVPHSLIANSWSVADVRSLRDLAGNGVPVDAIAATLRRSASAVKNKAGMHGISLLKSGKARAAADAHCGAVVARRRVAS